MILGFNSDVVVQGLSYHVQTEDWGFQHKCVVSRVFRNGAVLKTYKVTYLQVFGHDPHPSAPFDSNQLRAIMQQIHQKILDLLVSGQFREAHSKMGE